MRSRRSRNATEGSDFAHGRNLRSQIPLARKIPIAGRFAVPGRSDSQSSAHAEREGRGACVREDRTDVLGVLRLLVVGDPEAQAVATRCELAGADRYDATL